MQIDGKKLIERLKSLGERLFEKNLIDYDDVWTLAVAISVIEGFLEEDK